MQTVAVKKSNSIIGTLGVFAGDIKISHSIFALPFVGVALMITGLVNVSPLRVIQIILCMVFARSYAMGMNRYLDREIDLQNERTKSRAIPAGKISHRSYFLVTIFFGVAFILTSFSLSNLAGTLSLPLLVVLGLYSVMKKISWLTHWYLGLCLGLAPVATEIALFDRITSPVILIGIAVAFWTAGFDLLYSLQDRDFDISQGLHSVPAKLGHKAAIWFSRASFLIMATILAYVGVLIESSFWWFVGVAVVALILMLEHWIIRDAMTTGKSDRINVAFFNLNAMVSLLFFIFSVLSAYNV